MVDLAKFVGKKVEVTFKLGDQAVGVIESRATDHLYNFRYSDRYIYGITKDGECGNYHYSITEIEELVEPQPEESKMEVDLSKFVGKQVKMTFSQGIGVIESRADNLYNFRYENDTYGRIYNITKGGECLTFLSTYHERPLNVPRSIVKIEEVQTNEVIHPNTADSIRELETNKWDSRTTEITVVASGENLRWDGATRIRLEDEGAGEFVSLEQDGKKLTFCFEELEEIVLQARLLSKGGKRGKSDEL